jgi:Uncharacterized conserved protein (DUF2183)
MSSGRYAFMAAMIMTHLGAIMPVSAGSAVAPREHVEVFTTAGRLTADRQRWLLPVHAWVYVPQNSRVRKAAFASLLKARHGLAITTPTTANFDRRANLLFADNIRGRAVILKIAGRQFTLPPTGPNGHARGELEMPVSELTSHAAKGQVPVEIVLPAGDRRTLSGLILLVQPAGISVISDIDDTIKISDVLDQAKLFDATFYKDFAAVPGMASLYEGWARKGAAVHFVSSSPWHLYAPLREMLNQAGFPVATLDLKQIRLKDSSILDLLKDASKTKPPQIEALLAAYPQRRFVLVGDSGELDPEIYAAIARRHPSRIARIFIRNVTGGVPHDGRFAKAFAGVDPVLWQLFADPAQISWQPK